MEKPHEINQSVEGCVVESVCVFGDRAEVSRRVEFAVEAGTTEIILNGGTTNIDRSTIRVSGGAGAITILEVTNTMKVKKMKATTTAAAVAMTMKMKN